MSGPEYRVFEHPDVTADLQAAPSEVLRALGRLVYPVLRSDPTNVSGAHPIRWEPSWFIYRLDLAIGQLLVAYQALEEERAVLVIRIALIPSPP